MGQRTVNGKKILWSRGNGWAFAGIARVLEYLPKNNHSRQGYVDIFVRQAGELIKRQGADGLWRANLDDPNEFPDPESSGTGFFCFGLAWGINQGFLNRQVKKAWRGLTQNVSPGGKVLWGQLVDDQPHATAHTSMLPAHFCWREARYIIWPTQNSAPGMANKQARFKMYPVFFPSAG
ncbi:MAG: hypothetical protein DMG26_13300 [Acidobacteria bacterium]|nr:MAG: hypothetical protein DMG26_13300 [Acidobacteriota bacterium]